MSYEISSSDGILLLTMGGPEKTEEVEPFLKALFSDPDIIPFPGWLSSWLAPAMARRRARRVAPAYEKIGGSPLPAITRRLAQAVEGRWRERGGGPAAVAMRYLSSPDTEKALRDLAEAGMRRVVVLPLYPQYCGATTGSHLSEVERLSRKSGGKPALWPIRSWHQEPEFWKLWEKRIKSILAAISNDERKNTVMVFSAHGIPRRLERHGDPYLTQVRETVAGICSRLGEARYRLGYQSRGAGVAWSRPYLKEVMGQAIREGAKSAVVAPVSFVSDHIETLYELDISLADWAAKRGMKCHRVPVFNDDADFAELLVLLACRRLSSREGNL